MAWLEVFPVSSFPSSFTSKLFYGCSNFHERHVNVVGDLLTHHVKVVSHNDRSYHVDNVVSADTSHHEPLIHHYEESEVMHLVPLACSILHRDYEAGTNVTRVEEVV